jgi:hypothetical protein
MLNPLQVPAFLVLVACGNEPVAAKPAPVEVEARNVERAAYPAKASFDFRMVYLDPGTIGTTQRCDVAAISVSKDDETRPIGVRCAAGPIGSQITFARSSDVIAALKKHTQIEVTIDAEGIKFEDSDARVTLVKVIGELAPPKRPSKCCDRHRHRDAQPKPPKGWDFKLYKKDRRKHWRQKHICLVSQVQEVMRSSPGASEFSSGRVFDPETLPYAARVYCDSPTGSASVFVGSRDPKAILRLERGQAIEIELGWTSRAAYPAGKLGSTVYPPEFYPPKF